MIDPVVIKVFGQRDMTLNQALDGVPLAYEKESGWWVDEGFSLDVQIISVNITMTSIEYSFLVRRL